MKWGPAIYGCVSSLPSACSVPFDSIGQFEIHHREISLLLLRTHFIVRYYNMRYISQSVISNDTWLRLNDESHSLGQVFWSLASDLRSWDKAEE